MPQTIAQWSDFSSFEAFLTMPGPWIAGLDFPFGQSRQFLENAGWPIDWQNYVAKTSRMSRQEFCKALEDYKHNRAIGDKEHRRKTDIKAASISPQKLYGVPVAKMFYEGASRLLASDVTIPHIKNGLANKICVEAYPGVLVRGLIGKTSYKNDTRAKQTAALKDARQLILEKITQGALQQNYGLTLALSEALQAQMIEDASGDSLDALLCAIQAAWSYTKRHEGFGAPHNIDSLEGWIADPYCC